MIESFLKQAILGAATAAVLGMTSLAHADALVTQKWIAPPPQYFGLTGIGRLVPTGGFEGTWNSEDITFWCIELNQYFSLGTTYTDNYSPSVPDDEVFTLLGQLFHEAYGAARSDSMHSAAFQLAIWEIVYDRTSLSLGGGTFQVTNINGHDDTVRLANEWLRDLGNYTDNYMLIRLRSLSNQDFVTYGTPLLRDNFVPEPAPFTLLGAAMLAMWTVVRRRRKQSAR
jgi:hypothetical protein